MANTNFEISVENFIKDEYSICREERQYAVFLYNILRKYKPQDMRPKGGKIAEIFDACKIPPDAKIEHVFYEAAFMRDFFVKDRNSGKSSFNDTLIEYVGGPKGVEHNNYNLGRNKINGYSYEDNESAEKAKEMMNAKPDIAVIYNQNGKDYLLFLECKFESSVPTYDSGKKQTEIQYMVAEFLCEHYLKTVNESLKLNCSPKMKKDEKSCVVNFTRKVEEKEKIFIADLIDLNKGIFGEGNEKKS